MDVEEGESFDLQLVLDCFKKCTSNKDGALVMQHYVDAFKELCRFFQLTGRLFGFVAKDLNSKIRVIEYHMTSKKAHHYTTIDDMVQFEVAANLTQKRLNHNVPNGCRTLLRLHRALEFILQFMLELSKSSDDASVAAIANEVYYRTLAKHHPWVVQKMAAFALYALPNRKDLIRIMCRQSNEEVLILLKQVVEAGQPVYNATNKMYEEQNLLNLR